MLEKIKGFIQFLSQPESTASAVARSGLILVGGILLAFILIKVLHWIVNRLMKRKRSKNKRINTLRKLINSVITYTIVLLALVQILQSAFNINLGAIIAAAGVLGVAVGFGSQTLVKDVIAGFFILLEGQYSVGDRITVSGFTGTVDELGLRSTRVRGDNGDLFILPNGSIVNLTNHSLLPHAFFISCILPPEADSAAVMVLFDTVGKKAEDDLSILTKPPIPSLCPAPAGEGYSIRLKVTCSVESQDLLEKEMLHRLGKALDKAGVTLPEDGLTIIRD